MEKTKNRKGIRYSKLIHLKARELRQQGRTHRDIAKELGISHGSAHEWTVGIELFQEQIDAIFQRRNQHVWTPQEKELARQRLMPFWRKKYQPEELLDKIKEFYQENGRIPLKREFNSLRVFRYNFGSWNNAIKAAGFEPNPVLFAKKFISRDGHRCDSFTEKIIDDWFFQKGIEHERNWRYGDTKMTADFFMTPDLVIEFFGLAGVQKHYDELIEMKRSFCEERNLRLIEIYPDDLFPKNHLTRKLSPFMLLF